MFITSRDKHRDHFVPRYDRLSRYETLIAILRMQPVADKRAIAKFLTTF